MEKYIPYIIFIVILVCTVIVVLSSKRRVHIIYKKYIKVKNSLNLTGKEFVFVALDMLNLQNIKVVYVKKKLSDAFIPSKKIIVLSNEVLESASIASLTIISHELGHAVQDRDAHPLLRLSQLLFFVTKITNPFILPLLLAGGVLCFFYPLGFTLLNLSLIFFLVHAVNKILCLPIEKNASDFAKKFLKTNDFITKKEEKQAGRLLSVAYLTYVASLLDGIFFVTKRRKN